MSRVTYFNTMKKIDAVAKSGNCCHSFKKGENMFLSDRVICSKANDSGLLQY